MIEAGFATGGISSGGLADGFDAFFNKRIGVGDFTRANFGFNAGLDFKVDVGNVEIVVFEGGGDEVEVAIAKLFDVEGVFDANFDVATIGRDKGSILEPGRKISS